MSKLIAVYGTLRAGLSNHHFLMREKFVGFGQTSELYTLRASGIPYVGKDPLHHVAVEVYEVEDQSISSIDGLEGHPRWYKRERISIDMEDGTLLVAWLYFMESTTKIIESGNYLDYGSNRERSEYYWRTAGKARIQDKENIVYTKSF